MSEETADQQLNETDPLAPLRRMDAEVESRCHQTLRNLLQHYQQSGLATQNTFPVLSLTGQEFASITVDWEALYQELLRLLKTDVARRHGIIDDQGQIVDHTRWEMLQQDPEVQLDIQAQKVVAAYTYLLKAVPRGLLGWWSLLFDFALFFQQFLAGERQDEPALERAMVEAEKYALAPLRAIFELRPRGRPTTWHTWTLGERIATIREHAAALKVEHGYYRLEDSRLRPTQTQLAERLNELYGLSPPLTRYSLKRTIDKELPGGWIGLITPPALRADVEAPDVQN